MIENFGKKIETWVAWEIPLLLRWVGVGGGKGGGLLLVGGDTGFPRCRGEIRHVLFNKLLLVLMLLLNYKPFHHLGDALELERQKREQRDLTI